MAALQAVWLIRRRRPGWKWRTLSPRRAAITRNGSGTACDKAIGGPAADRLRRAVAHSRQTRWAMLQQRPFPRRNSRKERRHRVGHNRL